jgi:hypothetical protein
MYSAAGDSNPTNPACALIGITFIKTPMLYLYTVLYF